MLQNVYNKTKESLRTADKLTAVLISIILVSLIFIMPVYADEGDGSRGNIADELNGVFLNINDFSAKMTDSFSKMMTATTLEDGSRAELLKKIDSVATEGGSVTDSTTYQSKLYRLGVIGNILGVKNNYTNLSSSTNIFSPGDDASTRRLTLSTVRSWYGNDGAAIEDSAMIRYILMGSTLNALGIDEFRDAQQNDDGFRMITGYATYICYMLAHSAGSIMDTVVDVMDKLNVFSYVHKYLTGESTNMIGSNSKFMNTVKGIYVSLLNFRWVIFGFLIIFFVASITVFKSKQMNNASRIQIKMRNLGIRVVVMCIGIPLVAMVYSTCIDLVRDGLEKTQYRVSDFIYAQFLDYERWTVARPISAFDGLDALQVEYVEGNKTMSVKWNNVSDYKLQYNKGKKPVTGEVVNASEFVYFINNKIYGLQNYGDVAHTTDLYYAESQESKPDVYGSMLENSKVDEDTTLDATKFKAARDLILGYARGNRVVADSVNDAYFNAQQSMTKELTTLLKDEDEASASAATAVEQLFSPNATEYTALWTYVGFKDGETPTSKMYKENVGTKIHNPIVEGKLQFHVNGIPMFAGETGEAKDNGILLNDDSTVAVMQELLGLYEQDYNDKPSSELEAKQWAENGGMKVIQRHISATGGSADTSAQCAIAATLNLSVGATKATDNDIVYTMEFIKGSRGMSALSMYNFMHTKFELDTMDIHAPTLTSNSGVGMMHYAVTLPYTGVPELIQLAYTICILFSIGIIGWVFGVSLLLNTFIQTIKALPLIFKMCVGSMQGFVEAILTVLSIAAELLITIFLYVFSIQIIDFLIIVINAITTTLLETFVTIGGTTGTGDAETASIFNNLISMAGILWGTFELIKWRQAITMSIKSLLTHVLNQVFGTSAQMPSSEANGMLKAAAVGATAAVAAGALADSGTLDDVVNDVSNSTLGDDISEQLKQGDFEGAMDSISDYAAGEGKYSDENRDVRGGSEADRMARERGMRAKRDADGNRMYDEATGEALYEGIDGNTYTKSEMETAPNAYQNLTEDQEADMQSYQDAIDNATTDEEREEAEQAYAAAASQYRRSNYEKAAEAGVADWATHEQSLADAPNADGTFNTGRKVASVEGAENLKAENASNLDDPNAANAYKAAATGDVNGLYDAAQTYNNHGITASQVAEVNEMVANGASEEEVAAAVDNFAQSNFGNDYKDVVSKINEASGRSDGFTYGSNDNSTGGARTVTAVAHASGNGMSYGVTDNNSNAGEQTISVVEDGSGSASYSNLTKGGGSANTIQTLDMGSEIAEGAQSYAATYNATAAMVRKGGVDTGINSGGAGGTNVVTVSEMAAMASQMQMAENNVEIIEGNYGNTAAGAIGLGMTTAYVRAASAAAASGQTDYNANVMTPVGLSSDTASQVGVTSYVVDNSGSSGSSGTNVVLKSNGGTETGPKTITVDYNNQNGGTDSIDFTGLNAGYTGQQATMSLNISGGNSGNAPGYFATLDNTQGYTPIVTSAPGNNGTTSSSGNGSVNVNINWGNKGDGSGSESNADGTLKGTLLTKTVEVVENILENVGDDGTGTDTLGDEH